MKRKLVQMIVLSVLIVALIGFAVPQSAQAQTGCMTYHTVQYGQNLYRVGLIYNLTWDVIATANGITNGNWVYAGTVLCIPYSTTATTTTEFGTGGPVGDVPSTEDIVNAPAAQVTFNPETNQVTLTASGFYPNTRYDVYIDSISTDFSGGVVITGNASAAGTIERSFTLPKVDTASVQYVTVVGSFGQWARTFLVR